jgi:hypothetical protein
MNGRIEEGTLGAVVLILKDTGSALGFVIFKERFTFWVKGPLTKVSEEEGGEWK